MKKLFSLKTALQAILLLGPMCFAGCGSDNDDSKQPVICPVDDPRIGVTPETLAFLPDGTPAAGNTFTVASNCTWQAVVEPGKEWVRLSPAEGEADGSVAVTIPAPVEGGGRAAITFTASRADGKTAAKTVYVEQSAGDKPGPEPEPEPEPGTPLTITVDFGLGASVATPELPPYSKTGPFTTGRHEYLIGAYTYAVFVDEAMNGKFYWIDNTQFSATIPEPNKGLYFSKEGAYVEFPAIAGKALSKVEYIPTTNQNEVELDLLDADGGEPMYSRSDVTGYPVYELIDPSVNTHYRLTVIKGNAQVARLTLTYDPAE